MKLIVLFLNIISSIAAFSQSQKSAYKKPEWERTQFEPRFGLGYQKSILAEAGVGYHWFGGDIVRTLSKAVYSSLEFSSFRNPVYGLKIGAETLSGMGIGGIEIKYQTNTNLDDLVITPKVGLSALGLISAFYGYNISTNNYPFDNIGKHQFSLVLMYYKGMFKSR